MKISTDVAEKDIERFISALEINPMKLEELEEEKERCIKLIEHGFLTIDEKGLATFKLFKAVSYGDEDVSEIKFRSDMPEVKDMEKNTIGKNDIEKTRRMFAFLISGQYPSAFFSRMKSDDLTNFSHVAAFFLPR